MNNIQQQIDPEEQAIGFKRRKKHEFLWVGCCLFTNCLSSWICKQLCNRKKRVGFLLLLEIISYAFDQFGRSKWPFIFAAFLVSALSCHVTIDALIRRTNVVGTTGLQNEWHLMVDGFLSLLQFIIASSHLIILIVSSAQNIQIAQPFTLVIASFAFFFAFKKKEEVTDRSRHARLINSMPSSSKDRFTVHMPTIALQRQRDWARFNCYEDLYNEVEKMFNIEGHLGHGSEWQLVYYDDYGYAITVGDHPWDGFCTIVKEMYIYESKSLR